MLRLTNLIEFMTYTYADHAYFPGLDFPVFQNYRKRSWLLPDVLTTVQRNRYVGGCDLRISE